MFEPVELGPHQLHDLGERLEQLLVGLEGVLGDTGSGGADREKTLCQGSRAAAEVFDCREFLF